MIVFTAANLVRLHLVDKNKWQWFMPGHEIVTTYEVYDNFPTATNRPKSWIIRAIEDDKVDAVVQFGYDGTKTEIVRAAEALDLDVYLVRNVQ